MFAGRMSRGAYARAAAIRIGLFVAATVAFPFVLYAIIKSSNCAGIGGACGALALVVSFYIKPPLYILLVLSFVGITVRRVRDIGLPVALAAAVPVLMLGDVIFGMTFGAHWSLAFTFGAITQQFPRDLIMALACIGFLCVARSQDEAAGGDGRRWGMPGAIALGIVVSNSIFALISLANEIALVLISANSVMPLTYTITYISLAMSPVLLIAMFVLVVRQQRRLSAA
jgi:uncharacterized membrane protein YhaH (DUF805 family)